MAPKVARSSHVVILFPFLVKRERKLPGFWRLLFRNEDTDHQEGPLSLSATQKNIIHHFAQLLDHPRNKDQALLYTQNTAVFICLFGEFYRVREEPGLEIFQEETTHQPALFSYYSSSFDPKFGRKDICYPIETDRQLLRHSSANSL